MIVLLDTSDNPVTQIMSNIVLPRGNHLLPLAMVLQMLQNPTFLYQQMLGFFLRQ